MEISDLFRYFKGIYLTTKSWRTMRSSDDWNYSCQVWCNIMAGDLYKSGDYGLSMYFHETKIILNQQNQNDCPGKVKVDDHPK